MGEDIIFDNKLFIFIYFAEDKLENERPLEFPIGRITKFIYKIFVLPLKPIAGSTKLKTIVEKASFEPGTDVHFDAIIDFLSSKIFQELPGLAFKDNMPVPELRAGVAM